MGYSLPSHGVVLTFYPKKYLFVEQMIKYMPHMMIKGMLQLILFSVFKLESTSH